jgi:predicted phosphoadenosine phosphosulfate sulfurtransferase
MKSGRAPSYKAIAMAILSNDIYFYSIGFEQKQSSILMGIIEANKPKNETQIRLFA